MCLLRGSVGTLIVEEGVRMELCGKTILVVGAAKSGVAAALFLAKHGSKVYINELKPREQLEQESVSRLEAAGVTLLCGQHVEIDDLQPQLVIPSPGVPLNIPSIERARELNIAVWSEMELASRYTEVPMIVITGTNGKTTTTALVGQIMQDAGKRTFIGGNIGVPFISEAESLTVDDVAVLEASSFQLEPTVAFKPKVALILNITPDHLDRHGSMAGYIEAKVRVLLNQDEHDYLILNWDDEEARKLAGRAKAKVIFFSRKHKLEEGFLVIDGQLTALFAGKYVPIIPVNDIFIKGGHNLENALAAVAAGWVMKVSTSSLAHSLSTFPGVEHRLESVATIKGVEYINDSKGTNPDASIKALEAYDRPIILIAGGKSKGSDFVPFAKLIKEKAKALILVGQAVPEIEAAVQKVGYVNYRIVQTFKDAVVEAGKLATSGDIVLLSPACASYDLFDNYEQRGRVFKDLVRELETQG